MPNLYRCRIARRQGGELGRGSFHRAWQLGAIAGAIFATTPQGRKTIADIRKKAANAWAQPNLQRRVSDGQTQVRDRVPFVGNDIADAIGRTKPPAAGASF